MLTFLKSQTASLMASILDLLLTIGLVEIFGVWYGMANVLGNIGGAVANFMIGRFWVFEAVDKPTPGQVWKYAIAWIGYVAINFLLLILVKDIFDMNYTTAKVLVAVGLAFTYNYILQKKFVFK
jgi:putative flippase GtrA